MKLSGLLTTIALAASFVGATWIPDPKSTVAAKAPVMYPFKFDDFASDPQTMLILNKAACAQHCSDHQQISTDKEPTATELDRSGYLARTFLKREFDMRYGEALWTDREAYGEHIAALLRKGMVKTRVCMQLYQDGVSKANSERLVYGEL